MEGSWGRPVRVCLGLWIRISLVPGVRISFFFQHSVAVTQPRGVSNIHTTQIVRCRGLVITNQCGWLVGPSLGVRVRMFFSYATLVSKSCFRSPQCSSDEIEERAKSPSHRNYSVSGLVMTTVSLTLLNVLNAVCMFVWVIAWLV